MENSLKEKLAESPQDLVDAIEDKARAFAESLSRLVDSVESVANVAKRFFGIFQQQKQHLVDLSHGAVENVAPVVEMGRHAIGKGRDLSVRIVNKGRAHPTAVLVGAACVVGGIALLAYYLRDKDEFAEQKNSQEFVA